MAKKVFFSFHFQNDSWRASQVRNIGAISKDTPPFLDKAEWEKIERNGDASIKKWIDDQLHGCSTTIILAGSNTYGRKYINYEIKKSFELNKKILVIHIHNLKNQFGETSTKGNNPLDHFYYPSNSNTPLSYYFDAHDPKNYQTIEENIENWINRAKSPSDIRR